MCVCVYKKEKKREKKVRGKANAARRRMIKDEDRWKDGCGKEGRKVGEERERENNKRRHAHARTMHLLFQKVFLYDVAAFFRGSLAKKGFALCRGTRGRPRYPLRNTRRGDIESAHRNPGQHWFRRAISRLFETHRLRASRPVDDSSDPARGG